MVEFAGMSSGSGQADPVPDGSVAVADRPAVAPESAPEFVYQPWKLKELRRLYVNLIDGTKVGYLDLATLDAVPESGETGGLLQRALKGLSPAAAERRLQTAQPGGTALQPVPAALSVLPWTDLAANRPGHLIENQDDASYRAGVAGEQRTAGVLAGLEREGYRVLHSVPLSPRKDIDHLVIGPTGIWAINTKATTYDVAAKADGTVYSDGYRQKWIESLTRDAGLAGEYLARAARMELAARPVVSVWSTMNVSSHCESLIPGEGLVEVLKAHSISTFPPAWVDVVYSVARRSDTWTAHH